MRGPRDSLPCPGLTVALDSPQAIAEIGHAAAEAGREVSVYVELDLGMHRVGVPRVEEAIALAGRVRDHPALDFAGIAFYPGHVREHVGDQDAKLRTLSGALAAALEQFKAAGIEVRVVSGGSTPTLWRTHEIEGITEFRPGTYVYNDRTTAALAACDLDDCALTVLATVISTAVPGQAVIDAGCKSLGREPMLGVDGEGFGQLLEHPDVRVQRLSEEHGVLDLSSSAWQPQVGERVRVIPNHVCIVVHLNDVVHGVRNGALEASWPITARGRGERSAQPTASQVE